MADWPTTGERPYGAKVKAYVDDKLPKDGTSAMTGPLAVDRSGNAQITTRNSSAPADNRKWTQTVQSSDGRVTFDAYNDANAWVGTRFEILRSGGVVVDGIRHLKGSGSPEGVVSGPVGSRYIDIAATNGAVEWVKFSGTGNTGWRVVYGDTGWRSVPSSLEAVTGSVRMRRVNEAIYIQAPDTLTVNAAAIASGSVLVAGLPVGWRPAYTTYGNWGVGPSSPANGTRLLTCGGPNLILYGSGEVWPGATLRFTLTPFPAADAWPSTLPGTAV